MGIVIAVIFFELVLHFFSKYRFDSMVYMKHRIYYASRHNWHKRYYRNSNLFGYELIPGVDKTVNSFGMRDREYSLNKPKGVYRILVLGDSITEFGNWTALLEEKLNSDNSDNEYEVLNCAVQGWNLYNYYLYLKYKGLKFEPDLVLIGLSLNDIPGYDIVEAMFKDNIKGKTGFYTLKNPGGERDIDATLRINPFLFKNSYFYRFMISNFIIRQKIGTGMTADNLIKDIKYMIDENILAVIFPYLKPIRTYSRKEIENYEMTVQTLDKSDISYLDLTGYFNKSGEKIVNYRLSMNDKIHFNREANKIKAEVIYMWIKEKVE